MAGSFDWPGSAGEARLYRYDSTGALVSADETVDIPADGAFEATVAEGGLLIAEILPQ